MLSERHTCAGRETGERVGVCDNTAVRTTPRPRGYFSPYLRRIIWAIGELAAHCCDNPQGILWISDPTVKQAFLAQRPQVIDTHINWKLQM